MEVCPGSVQLEGNNSAPWNLVMRLLVVTSFVLGGSSALVVPPPMPHARIATQRSAAPAMLDGPTIDSSAVIALFSAVLGPVVLRPGEQIAEWAARMQYPFEWGDEATLLAAKRCGGMPILESSSGSTPSGAGRPELMRRETSAPSSPERESSRCVGPQFERGEGEVQQRRSRAVCRGGERWRRRWGLAVGRGLPCEWQEDGADCDTPP